MYLSLHKFIKNKVNGRNFCRKCIIFAIVKILTTIFAFYFVLLAAMPCADRASANNEHIIAIETIDAHHTHESHTHELDLCSPFCVCNCCGVHIMSLKTVVLYESQPMVAFSTTSISTYKAEFFSKFSNSIWQPPQLNA